MVSKVTGVYTTLSMFASSKGDVAGNNHHLQVILQKEVKVYEEPDSAPRMARPVKKSKKGSNGTDYHSLHQINNIFLKSTVL